MENNNNNNNCVLVVILFVKCGLVVLGLSTRFFGPPSWTSSDLDHCIRKEKYIYLATFNLKRYTYIYILEFWERNRYI